MSSDTDGMDPASALELIEAEGRRIRKALDPRLPWQLLSWGLAWLIGAGALWLDVRDQRPYVGPGGLSAGVFVALLAVAGLVTGVTVAQGTAGVGGRAARTGHRIGLVWGLGWLSFMACGAAVVKEGAAPAVAGVLYAAGAHLVTGLIYAMSGAVWDDPVQVWLGCWLTILAGIAGFFGPVGVLLVEALGGGGGFLVAAWWARRRSVRNG